MPFRRTLIAVCFIIVGGAVLVGLAGLCSSSVGHFRTGILKSRYLEAYGLAMKEMPKPELTLNLRTSFGLVRVYRFKGQSDQALPVLLLPGRSSGTPVWVDNMPSLLQHRSVYTLDLLGEPGLSIQDCPITSDAEQAQWLHETIRQLPDRLIHVAGLSIGGWTAANLAIHRPEMIATLALIDPVLVFGELSGEVILRSLPASIGWFPKSWRDSFNSWTANDAPVEDVPVAEMIEAGMQGYSISLPPPVRISGETLAALELPVLVVIAGASRMHDAAAVEEEARRLLQRGTVLVYSGASHAVNGEEPERLGVDLAAFFASHE